MFRFTIRDVLWLMVVVALGFGWWRDRYRDGRRVIVAPHVINTRMQAGDVIELVMGKDGKLTRRIVRARASAADAGFPALRQGLRFENPSQGPLVRRRIRGDALELVGVGDQTKELHVTPLGLRTSAATSS